MRVSRPPHFQILAHQAGHGEVPWNGCVSMRAGGWRGGGTCALSVPRSSISEIRGVWELRPEVQGKKNPKKLPFSASIRAVRNFVPWD